MTSIKKAFIVTTALLMLTGLAGCASDFIDVRTGSKQVTLADASQVAGCQSKGEITVSVLAKIGFINRSAANVEANLMQLARNGAVDSGSDTIVKGNSRAFGERTFAIYKCSL